VLHVRPILSAADAVGYGVHVLVCGVLQQQQLPIYSLRTVGAGHKVNCSITKWKRKQISGDVPSKKEPVPCCCCCCCHAAGFCPAGFFAAGLFRSVRGPKAAAIAGTVGAVAAGGLAAARQYFPSL
jgi:hypothetical protein